MSDQSEIQEQLAALATHLLARRPAILKTWRASVDNDPDLTTGSTLSRTQFNDHIPDILDSFARRLKAWPDETSVAVQKQEHKGMISHGLHRWQQGFRLHELTREWGYLQLCIVNEVELYGKDHPELELTVIATALRALTHLCVAGISDSAEEYWQLHQAEAAERVRDLEQALASINEIENARSVGWHQAAHDLRGGLSIVSTASKLLHKEDIPEPARLEFTAILQRGVSSLHEMLNSLVELARLEAGHEQRTVASFDAATELNDFCFAMRPLAEAKGLFLKYGGPDSLPVEGDQIKVRRILQNLVLNALKYTQQGGIVIAWESRKDFEACQWMVTVQDTGPGFDTGSGIPMVNQLRDATKDSHEVENKATSGGTSSNQDEPAVTLPSQSSHRPFHPQSGEGIGLSIVKGLCDLLDATLELESSSGQGSTFRVTFPCFYQNSVR